jgi:hypothetical protein
MSTILQGYTVSAACAALVVMGMAQPAHAGYDGHTNSCQRSAASQNAGKSWQMSAGQHGSYASGRKALSHRLYKQAHLMLKERENLKLTDEQYAAIAELKVSVKKDMLLRQAAIDAVAVDIAYQLKQLPIDVEASGRFIKQKYDLQIAKATALVGALSRLYALLNEDQQEKFQVQWCAYRQRSH